MLWPPFWYVASFPGLVRLSLAVKNSWMTLVIGGSTHHPILEDLVVHFWMISFSIQGAIILMLERKNPFSTFCHASQWFFSIPSTKSISRQVFLSSCFAHSLYVCEIIIYFIVVCCYWLWNCFSCRCTCTTLTPVWFSQHTCVATVMSLKPYATKCLICDLQKVFHSKLFSCLFVVEGLPRRFWDRKTWSTKNEWGETSLWVRNCISSTRTRQIQASGMSLTLALEPLQMF